jgi:hypothetical protein
MPASPFRGNNPRQRIWIVQSLPRFARSAAIVPVLDSRALQLMFYTPVMRQRRRILLLALGVGVLLAVVVLLVASDKKFDPGYQGKHLSAWLRDFEGNDVAARLRAVDAVQHIGTNGLPLLTAELRDNGPKEEPNWKTALRALVGKQSLIHFTIPRPRSPRHDALAGLDALGPTAKDAAPFLENLLHEKPPDPRAALVLARLGPNGIPALTRALTSDEKAVRLSARVSLDMIESHSEILFPTSLKVDGFDARICAFNLEMLHAAFAGYKKGHSD